MKWTLTPLLLSLALSACSHQALYETAQRTHQEKCRRLPPAEFDRCMAEFDQSFKDYNKERQEVLNH